MKDFDILFIVRVKLILLGKACFVLLIPFIRYLNMMTLYLMYFHIYVPKLEQSLVSIGFNLMFRIPRLRNLQLAR